MTEFANNFLFDFVVLGEILCVSRLVVESLVQLNSDTCLQDENDEYFWMECS